jgi:putative membrane protein
VTASEPPFDAHGARRAQCRDRSRTMAGIVTGLAGLLLLAWLVRDESLADLGRRLAELGPVLPLAFVPYTLASLADALGWRVVLRVFGVRVPFARLWLVRLAGEAVNSVAPTGVGGEPLKAVLLQADGTSGSAAAAAVVVSRTCVVITQAILVVLGVGALLVRLGWTFAAPIAVASLFVVTGAFGLLLVRVQQRGAARVVARWAAWLLPSTWLADRMPRMARALDGRLATVYGHARLAVVAAAAWHMLAWLASAAEVWVVLRLLAAPISWQDALIIEGLAQPIRATGFVVPGALGPQEGGGIAVCRWLGIPPAVGLALWLVRRAREIIYNVVGLVYLAARRSRSVAGSGPGVGARTTSMRRSVSAGR